MASINLGDNASQVVKYWSARTTQQLREKLLLGGIVSKEFSGEIKQSGDTVKIYSVNSPNATVTTVGTANSNAFTGSAISTTSVDLKIDKIATAAYEFSSENEMLSLLSSNNPEVIQSLVFAVEKAINSHIYSVMIPSVAAPDHTVTGVTNFDNSQFLACRLLADTAKWNDLKPWYALLDPSYYNDVLATQTHTSAEYVSDMPVLSGKITAQRYGFNVALDNSLSTDVGYLFHPDAVNFVMAQDLQVKISDLHPTGKHGVMLSVSAMYGAALGIDGAKKCIKVTAA